VASVVSAAVVVFVFVGLLPRFGDLRDVWDIVVSINPVATIGLILLGVAAMVIYALMYSVAIPGLRPGDALAIHSMATAVANTVPAGGAVALGIWVAGGQRLGLGLGPTTVGMVLVGIWEFVSRLAVPAFVALGARLLGIDDSTDLGVLVAISLVMVAVIVVVWEVLRHDRWARRAGSLGEAIRRRLPERMRLGPPDLAESLVDLRHHASGAVSYGWWRLTIAMSLVHVIRIGILLLALRAVGLDSSDVPFSSVLLAYALTQLLVAIPVTPGGAGIAELSLTAILTAAGAAGEPALAAVVVYRSLVWFLPIVMGAIAAVWWRRRIRSPAATGEGDPVADPAPG
jgi:uncharacterized protein (TIRG00374 family)